MGNELKSEAEFLELPSGRLFSVRTLVANTNDEVVVFVPPFAEEMNKSRKMMALLLNELALSGSSGLLFDLVGTGDSQGELDDTEWSDWIYNLRDVVNFALDVLGAKSISFVALRTGALLLNDYLNGHHGAVINSKIKAIHYWNPVFNASQFVTQFLRLRLAADMMGEGGEKVTVKQLKAQLEALGQLEVAGYMLNQNLIAGMENARIALPQMHDEFNVWFYEISSMGKVTPGLQRMIPKVCGDSINQQAFSLEGPQFWSTQEIALCKDLIDMTVLNNSGVEETSND